MKLIPVRNHAKENSENSKKSGPEKQGRQELTTKGQSLDQEIKSPPRGRGGVLESGFTAGQAVSTCWGLQSNLFYFYHSFIIVVSVSAAPLSGA
ncbi:MAG: hypothetical protein R3F02_20875 [Thiolinea sp.]